MKIYVQPGLSGNILATVAIGVEYLQTWEKCALPSWVAYCHRHGLGLVAFYEEMISRDSDVWKKATWQKLLIGQALQDYGMKVNSVCYLDTDILISPFAPNVFDNYDTETICLVSQIKNLPQPLHQTLRRLAFLRHTHLNPRYPLDSALFMSPQQIFEFHGLPPHDDYACAGFFIFSVANHSCLLKGWFDGYPSGVQSLTGGGDEPLFNHELFRWGKISWLPYPFQALWTYEVAWRYPFLFDYGLNDEPLIRQCIEASLYVNHFLHFAGSWDECHMWKIGKFFDDDKKILEAEAYREYLLTPVTASPQGMIRP